MTQRHKAQGIQLWSRPRTFTSLKRQALVDKTDAVEAAFLIDPHDRIAAVACSTAEYAKKRNTGKKNGVASISGPRRWVQITCGQSVRNRIVRGGVAPCGRSGAGMVLFL
jgi:hypothetical protein